MKIIEDQCVQCGLPCLGDWCPHRNVPVRYCDYCQRDIVEYQLNDKDVCKDCAEEYLNFYFSDLTIYERAVLLGVKLKKIKKE